MKIFRLKLQGQLLLPILAVVAIGITALQGGSYWESSEVLEEEIVKSIGRDRDAAVRSIDEWFEHKVENIELWSKDDRLWKTIDGDQSAQAHVSSFLRKAKEASSDINSVVLVSASGDIVARAISNGKVKNVSGREYFKAAMQGKTYISKPLISKNSGAPVLMVSTPVRDETGNICGVLVIVTEFGDLYRQVLKPIKIGTSGFAFATNSAGLTIAHPDSERIMKESVVDSEFGKEMLSKGKGIYKYYSKSEKQRMAIAYGVTEGTRWHVAVTVSLDELLAPLKVVRNLVLFGVLFTILIAGGVIFFIVRRLTAALKIVVGNAIQIADGTVDIEVPESLASKQDEIGELGRAFRQMAENLRMKIEEITEQSAIAETKATEAMEATHRAEEAQKQAERARKDGMLQAAGSLEEIVVQVASASEELNLQIQDSRKGADVQRERVAETATAMEQMNATVLEVAGNASSAAENADNAHHQADEGQQIVNRVTDSIGRLNKEAEKLQSEMSELGQQAQAIGQIMTVISDIADQTNLLALNAAIEAARAGDAGRGFAVVADEVRKLAEKTMTATQQVGNAIGAIQDSTTRSIHSMEQTSQMVDESTELTEVAGKSLTNILENVGQTADQVRAIATAAEEQSAATEQISRGAEEINSIAMETSGAMGQSAVAVSELAELSDKLKTIIEDMKHEGSSK